LIVLNPFMDFLCNFGFKNIGLTPGIPKGGFQHPQDIVRESQAVLSISNYFTELIFTFLPTLQRLVIKRGG
jgi:hypothetical protein